MSLKELANEISVRQAKNRKAQKKEQAIMAKKIAALEDGLRQLPYFKGDCPECNKPCIVFPGKDYDWNNREAAKDYSTCVLSGSDVMHHDSCFFGRYGHLD